MQRIGLRVPATTLPRAMAASSAAEDIIPGAAVLLENAKRTSVLRLSGLTITLVGVLVAQRQLLGAAPN